MKKVILASLVMSLSFGSVFAAVEDNAIIEELSEKNTVELSGDSFEMKTFDSCESFEKTTQDFLKKYNKKYPPRVYYNRTFGEPLMLEDAAFDEVEVQSTAKSSNGAGGTKDTSTTNEQVKGVSESEIIHTDGDYIYYMSDYYDNSEGIKNYQDRQKKNVFIIDANTMKVVKKINLPKHFWGTKMYLQDDKLVIIASGRPASTFQKQFWNNDEKTYTIIYDVSKPSEAKMLKAFMTEGSFSKSRMIENKLYVISNKNVQTYFRGYNIDDDVLQAEDIMPKGLEIVATDVQDEQNVTVKGKKQAYKVNSGFVAKCNTIEYILPDSDSDLGYPSFNMVSVIDIEDISASADTKVIFGNVSEIFMNLENLYITNSVYKTKSFSCAPGMRCIQPYYYGGTNHTMIHKLNVNGEKLDYQTSALVKGSPLTQYSMDEYKGDFRILTKTNRWNGQGDEAHTDLFVLDKDLKLKSTLENLGTGEEFKSSRYIGDKLFLVTFEQVDPLFVIDLADAKNPKILGELKIPGYSTYLHPYDENHLIGIGQDTKTNENGGVYNAGVKVDLYEINYDKTCKSSRLSADEIKKCESGDYKGIIVKQKYTKTFGGYGSYSEALSNPRMFQYKAKDDLLLLPMTLKQSAPNEKYRSIDFFQGLVAIDINKNREITEKYKISHLDTASIKAERVKACEKYTPKQPEEETCVKLIGGGEYCSSKKQSYSYVPKYCYADATDAEYLASTSWNHSKNFVKRAIWIDNKVYTISDTSVKKSDLYTGKEFETMNLR